MTVMTEPLVTAAHRERYERDGFCIFERVIPSEHLDLLRDCCAAAIARCDARMDAQGVDRLGITHRGSRYFVTHPSIDDPRLFRFTYSDRMQTIARGLLGDDVWMFWEQYVCKGPEQGMAFAWHQDSGYTNTEHAPYLTCWCALDDMSAANGTVAVLPYDRAGGKVLHPHRVIDDASGDLVGYTGDDPGELVAVPAGSIVCFSSYTLHRSGANTSNGWRRTYLIQYSGEAIRSHQNGMSFYGRCERVLAGGQPAFTPRV